MKSVEPEPCRKCHSGANFVCSYLRSCLAPEPSCRYVTVEGLGLLITRGEHGKQQPEKKMANNFLGQDYGELSRAQGFVVSHANLMFSEIFLNARTALRVLPLCSPYIISWLPQLLFWRKRPGKKVIRYLDDSRDF